MAHSGFNAATFSFSLPPPVFDRNQGEIARSNSAITRAREQETALRTQALTDAKDAFDGLLTSDRIARFYESGYLEIAGRNRAIGEYAYNRGAVGLLDFLDSERSYRSTQLSYRQASLPTCWRSNNCGRRLGRGRCLEAWIFMTSLYRSRRS